jgi:hypothetical protein
MVDRGGEIVPSSPGSFPPGAPSPLPRERDGVRGFVVSMIDSKSKHIIRIQWSIS